MLKKLKICAICVKNVELCAKLSANISKKEPFTSILCTLFIKKEKTKKRKKIITYTKSSHFIQNFMPQYSSKLSTFIKNT